MVTTKLDINTKTLAPSFRHPNFYLAIIRLNQADINMAFTLISRRLVTGRLQPMVSKMIGLLYRTWVNCSLHY